MQMNASPYSRIPLPSTERYDTHVPEPLVQGNPFRTLEPRVEPLPLFPQVQAVLPEPVWPARPAVIDCYWRAWQLAFGNVKQPTPANGFVANYCDTAFNGNLFLWDSAFVTFFGVYGRRAFDFQATLDNFYAKQHPDGFICRELAEDDGGDAFHRFDPSSTGPNLFPWAEWNHYRHTGDAQRLERVLPGLLAYSRWLRTYRTWLDGSYYASGWGCGMDSLPRLRPPGHIDWSHGHMSWIDTTLQAVLMARCLVRMAQVVQREALVAGLVEESERLATLVNETMWHETTGFYSDRYADGTLSMVKHIGAYWALLAEVVPPHRLPPFLAHLDNPQEFNRPHRIPALSADDPAYDGTGGYWCGCVWPPTNYMVLKGLAHTGHPGLAHQIAINHLEQVVQVYQSEDTRWAGAERFRHHFQLPELTVEDKHTLWENYAAEEITPGQRSKPGYVGWSGLPPIAVLLEDVFGLVPNAPQARLHWAIRLLDEHGVNRYPFGGEGLLDLHCARRRSAAEKPVVNIASNIPLTAEITWEGGREEVILG
jgi:hypothetical protein